MNKFLNKCRDQRGFTLIELIVVVAIIGLLAWLITPRVIGQLNTSKQRSSDAAANEILSAMNRYAADPTHPGTFPLEANMDTLAKVGTVLDVTVTGADNFLNTGHFGYQLGGPGTFCIALDSKYNTSTTYFIRADGVTTINPDVAPDTTCGDAESW